MVADDQPELPITSRSGGIIDGRVALLSGLALVVGPISALLAHGLLWLIGAFTNLSFHGSWTVGGGSPRGGHLGWALVGVPVVGGIIVGLMARYGSRAICGHGIPEVMERVLFHDSRIAPAITLLKPLSSAVAIGTGGPFGAEGPIIATGGALGSLIGQVARFTPDERKILVASGAAAGMAATFGTPVSAVLLAIELLLFEYRARSLVPVSLAAASAAAIRVLGFGSAPVFPTPAFLTPTLPQLVVCLALGAVLGLGAAFVSHAVYWVEDVFAKIPIHWMWWPALGGLVVGVVGVVEPGTLGVGYDNIRHLLDGEILGWAALAFGTLKLISWAIALGSGTSGGTLAPLFTIGGALGAAAGTVLSRAAPGLHLEPRLLALVGMAAMFAGASRALLASVVFAFEATQQPGAILPLVAGCTAAFMVASLVMETSIMTEKIVRHGARVLSDYSVDFLDAVRVGDAAQKSVVTVSSQAHVPAVRAWLLSGESGSEHQAYPVVDPGGLAVGIIGRHEVLHADPHLDTVGDLPLHPLLVVHPDNSLREAADHMLAHQASRVMVVEAAHPRAVIGVLSSSDILAAHRTRLTSSLVRQPGIPLHLHWRERGHSAPAPPPPHSPA